MSESSHDFSKGPKQSNSETYVDPAYKSKGPLFPIGHTSGELDGKK